MKNSVLMIVVLVWGLGLGGRGQVHADDHAASPGAQLAERYGLSGWDQIREIEFTFNVQRPNGKTTQRAWRWDIVAREVTRTVDGESQSVPADGEGPIHKQYINDTYWLLFPFQLVWSDPVVTDESAQLLPIGGGEATKLISQWPAAGGYTPGDAYDLYLDQESGLIRQWVFRRGGGEKGRPMTWENHQQLGPIIVGLDHYNANRSFRLWFTGVKATLAGGTVVTPMPLAEPAAGEGVESE